MVRSNPAAKEKSASLANEHGIKAVAYKVDGKGCIAHSTKRFADPMIVTVAEEVEKNVARVVQDFGKIDVFIANAGKESFSMRHFCF